MVNYHSNLVTVLSAILPTYYELNLSREQCSIPCISYIETNNYQSADGDNLGYSRITYQIKVWDNSIANIQGYVLLIDNALKAIGFKRTSAQELYDRESTMIQKILQYEALVKECY